jgi:uncharacterized membrane protein
MSWNYRYAIKSYVLSTVWIAPLLAFVLEQLTLRIALTYEIDFGWLPGFALAKEGVIAAADYVIASSIAFIVFTFSSMLVAIQVSSGQLTPRIIATTLLRNRAVRWSVGIFTYSLLLAVAVKTRGDAVPHSLVSLMAILALLSVLLFMFLIDYAARLLRPVNIVWRIAQLGMKVIESVYPDPATSAENRVPLNEKLGPPERTILHRGTSSIIIAVHLKALIAAARKYDCIVELVPRVGDFVAVDDPLFLIRGAGAKAIDARRLREQVAFGTERTIEQDSTFAFRVIVDIALKALSKSINDPTTAVIAIDQLQRLLRAVGRRKLRDEGVRGDDGQLRLIVRTPNWQDFVQLTFTEIRQYGAESVQVARRLRAMIETLMASLPESRLPALRTELDLLDRTVARFAFPEDVALARVADSQGLGGASNNASSVTLAIVSARSVAGL